jgi:hypothetical protein
VIDGAAFWAADACPESKRALLIDRAAQTEQKRRANLKRVMFDSRIPAVARPIHQGPITGDAKAGLLW